MAAINNNELKQLLLKEEQNKLTILERKKLDDWYNSFDITQDDLPIFRDAAHEQRIKQRLLGRIIDSGFPESSIQKRPTKYRLLLQWSSVAAVLAIFIGCVFLWKHTLNARDKDEILLSVQTGDGMLKSVTLEDGTMIWLNADSKLRYPAHFDKRHREVYLDGEAYFDVMHDQERPFTVHTAHLTTTVLGTAFSVTAYNNIPVESVVVSRGKVRVAHNNQVLGFLTPDKRVDYQVGNGKSYLSGTDATAAAAWKDGKLQFENQNMLDIAARLSRWYGYNVRFAHTGLKNCRYTASFDNHIPLNSLLKVMKAISMVNYRIDSVQKSVTFLGSGCNE